MLQDSTISDMLSSIYLECPCVMTVLPALDLSLALEVFLMCLINTCARKGLYRLFTPIKDNNADKDLSPAHLCMDLQPHSAADGESLPRTNKAYEVTSCCDLDQTVLKAGR